MEDLVTTECHTIFDAVAVVSKAGVRAVRWGHTNVAVSIFRGAIQLLRSHHGDSPDVSFDQLARNLLNRPEHQVNLSQIQRDAINVVVVPMYSSFDRRSVRHHVMQTEPSVVPVFVDLSRIITRTDRVTTVSEFAGAILYNMAVAIRLKARGQSPVNDDQEEEPEEEKDEPLEEEQQQVEDNNTADLQACRTVFELAQQSMTGTVQQNWTILVLRILILRELVRICRRLHLDEESERHGMNISRLMQQLESLLPTGALAA